jgi:hypothetical protein
MWNAEAVKLLEAALALHDEHERLKRLAPLCELHGTGSGTRSGCPYCALQRLSNALGRIDYLCGEPNEMEVSGYDVHCDEDAVVANVKNTLAAAEARTVERCAAESRKFSKREDDMGAIIARAIRALLKGKDNEQG